MIRRSFEVDVTGLPSRIVALPVRTRLVRAGDDLPDLVAAAVRGIASLGDVICISETAVAIAQGRSIPAETIRPTALARMLAERAGPHATVSQPESMQLVLESAGPWKVMAAAAASAAGRIVGRRGDFYRMLGTAISEIDGYTGTMPPYERHIVLGPREPATAAAAIAEACGCHAAVVDVNDLGIAAVLGASAHVNVESVAACLSANPHGNSDQQTPVVVLKYRPDPASSAGNPFEAAER